MSSTKIHKERHESIKVTICNKIFQISQLYLRNFKCVRHLQRAKGTEIVPVALRNVNRSLTPSPLRLLLFFQNEKALKKALSTIK